MEQSGLRERSKQRRHDAILVSGLRLFAERGYANTTLTDIAEAAEVSPRTVSLYFATKLDIALSYTNAACERLADALENRKAGTSVIEVLDAFLSRELENSDEQQERLVAEMMSANPSLQTLHTPSVERVLSAARVSLAADLQVSEDDFATQLAVATMVAVLAVYTANAVSTESQLERKNLALHFLSSALDSMRT